MLGSRELCLDWFWILLSLSEVSWKSHASGTERTGQSALSRGWERLLLFWLVAIGFSKMESFHQLGEFLRMLTNSKSPWKNTIWGICFGTFFQPPQASLSQWKRTARDSIYLRLTDPRHQMITCAQLIAVGPKWTISGPLLFWKVTVEIWEFSRGCYCYPTQIINEWFYLHYTQLLSLGSKCSNKIHQKKWMFGINMFTTGAGRQYVWNRRWTNQ